jgi:hypothetical protein
MRAAHERRRPREGGAMLTFSDAAKSGIPALAGTTEKEAEGGEIQ